LLLMGVEEADTDAFSFSASTFTDGFLKCKTKSIITAMASSAVMILWGVIV